MIFLKDSKIELPLMGTFSTWESISTKKLQKLLDQVGNWHQEHQLEDQEQGEADHPYWTRPTMGRHKEKGSCMECRRETELPFISDSVITYSKSPKPPTEKNH